jgi:FtsP/CotA-like multicopper oxidase with cupredoxin domain
MTLIIGALLLTACGAYRTGGTGMMRGDDMMHSQDRAESFLPGQEEDIASLPEAQQSTVMDVRDGDTISLTPTIVRKSINGKEFAMYGYNGQIPGPMIRATQGATITVDVKNSIDLPTTIHWHGIRLDNGNDGVPKVTQDAIEPNGAYRYTVVFPDEGMYWYHPHVREDVEQDMGLYGNLLVQPKEDGAYAPINGSEVVVLDDLLLDDNGNPVPYGMQTANRTLMGRFGDVFLINGDTSYERTVQRGSVIRFYLTNVANARPFRISIPGARMKLVGADVGRYEKESFIDSLTLGPAERGIVDVYFEKAGTYVLQHKGSARTEKLGNIVVTDEEASPDLTPAFEELRTNADVTADIDRFRPYFDKPVDKTLRLTIGMGMMNHGMGMQHGGIISVSQERHGEDIVMETEQIGVPKY